MSMSFGLRTSSTPTIDVTERLDSLTPPSMAMWLCASMMPGMTNRPVASISVAPRGTSTLVPTAAILPSRITIVPFSIVPFVTVRIVALRMTVTGAGALRERGRGSDRADRHQDGDLHAAANHRRSPSLGRAPGPRPAPGAAPAPASAGTSKRRPSTKTCLTVLLSPSRSPCTTIRLAILPASRLPRRSCTP